MKKANAILSVVVLSFFALLNVAAQEASFDDNTLNQLNKNSAELMKDRKLRVVTVEEEFENGGQTSVGFSKSIIEDLPPDRHRYIYETRTAEGIERTEYVDIGEKRFVRRNDGEWKIFVPSGSGVGSGDGSGEMPKIEKTVARTRTKGVMVNNQKTDLYKTVTSIKFIFPTRDYTNVYTESFWFETSGRLVKSFSESIYGDTKKSSRTTKDYDYNANIKIEKPIIKSKNKLKP